MSDTVKVGDVIALPVGIEPREGDPNFVRLYDASNFGVCPRIAKMFAVVVKNAINDHDRMREALEEIASTSTFCGGPGCYYCKSDIDHPPTIEAILAKKTLQTCDAQQENANG